MLDVQHEELTEQSNHRAEHMAPTDKDQIVDFQGHEIKCLVGLTDL